MNVTYEQITGLSAAKKLTVPDGCSHVWVQAETNNIRFRLDGTSPTASVGQILHDGDKPTVLTHGLTVAEFIEVAASATLNVTYFATS